MAQLSDRIKEIRKKEKLTQAEFAKKIGVHRAHVSKIESGTANPSYKLLREISDTFFIDFNWLLEGEGTIRPEWVHKTLTDIDIFENAPYEDQEKLAAVLLSIKFAADYARIIQLLGDDIQLLADEKLEPGDPHIEYILWEIIYRLKGWAEDEGPLDLSETERAVVHVLSSLDNASKSDIFLLLAAKGARLPDKSSSHKRTLKQEIRLLKKTVNTLKKTASEQNSD